MQAKRNSTQYEVLVETQFHIFELEHNLAGRVKAICDCSNCHDSAIRFFHIERVSPSEYPNQQLRQEKSTIRISTDAATIACVVERPTPCVPPLVENPK